MFLLDGLHEDLNRVAEKPYLEHPKSEGQPDAELAEIWWSNRLRREYSIVVALFGGQFKSSVVCRSAATSMPDSSSSCSCRCLTAGKSEFAVGSEDSPKRLGRLDSVENQRARVVMLDVDAVNNYFLTLEGAGLVIEKTLDEEVHPSREYGGGRNGLKSHTVVLTMLPIDPLTIFRLPLSQDTVKLSLEKYIETFTEQEDIKEVQSYLLQCVT